MPALESAKPAKRHLFSVYKSGQGRYVRWGTVAGAALIFLIGAWWMGDKVLRPYGLIPQAVGVMLWIVLGAILTFWAVNRPNFADFMIMTESEMRKVTWPSRREVVVATRVVIFLTFVLAGFLFVVDQGFSYLFQLLKIL